MQAGEALRVGTPERKYRNLVSLSSRLVRISEDGGEVFSSIRPASSPLRRGSSPYNEETIFAGMVVR
jgi:hypothetical protein